MKDKPTLGEILETVEGKAFELEAKAMAPTPDGWKPGVVWSKDNEGVVTSSPLTHQPESQEDWGQMLKERGLDPDKVEIVGDVRWTSYDGWKRDEIGGEAYSALLYSYRATVRLKTPGVPSLDLEQLYKETKKAKKPKKAAPAGGATLFVALSDWQIGNPDGGGTQEQVRVLTALPDQINERAKALRKAGVPIGTLCLAGLGDLVESTCGFYSNQQAMVELNRREQVKVVRRTLRDIFMETAPNFETVYGTCIAGNHGENRGPGGKALTDKSDNDDVAVFEQVAEILAANPEAFGHIKFRIPKGEMAVAVNVSGAQVGITHGHLARGGAQPVDKLWNWWGKQAFGRANTEIADSTIVVAGHYHHLNIKEQEGRTLMIAPSLTNVGEYYSDSNGVETRPGTLSFVIQDGKWGHLTIL